MGNRRADGTLKPSVRRARQRRTAERHGHGYIVHEAHLRFVRLTVPGTAVWNNADLREALDGDHAVTGRLLEEVAGEHRWAKLRDTHGLVRAIALPRNHRERALLTVGAHRDVMRARVLSRGRMEAAA